MTDRFHIAIVGSGPGGLSAAARAAEYDLETGKQDSAHRPSHILIEEFQSPAKTLHRYQKGKHVMAEPHFLDLRSPLQFRAGTREMILQWWARGIEEKRINVRYGAEVTGVEGEKGDFRISLKD
ncbi:MAG: hypothetical protein ACPGJE_04545, partial [Wenzhouxiangellaceae bacterium]